MIQSGFYTSYPDIFFIHRKEEGIEYFILKNHQSL